MNFITGWFKQLIASEQPMKEVFSVVDPLSETKSVDSLTLSLIPGTEELPEVVLSMYWTNSQDKVFEKKFSNSDEAMEKFNLYKSDLSKVQELSKDVKVDEAVQLMKNLLEDAKKQSEELVDGTPTPITTTMAFQKDIVDPKEVSAMKSWLMDLHEDDYVGKTIEDVKNDAKVVGFKPEVVEFVLNDLAKALNVSKSSFLSKEAKVTMQNIFFSTPEEAIQYQEKMKALNPQPEGTEDTLGLGDELPEGDLSDEIAPPSVSYEDAEKQKAEEEKTLTKRIETEVQDQVQSAMDKKIATMFSDKDEQLVKAMRGVGRTWEEIRDYLIKNLKYDKDGVAAYIDQFKVEEGKPSEVFPENEVVEEEPKVPTPPAETVSPETHDMLVEEAKTAAVDKIALDPLETLPPVAQPEISLDSPNAPPVPAGGDAPVDMIEETVDLQPGDRVYVMSDVDESNTGFDGEFVSKFMHKGKDFAVIEEEGRGLKEVPMKLVTKASLRQAGSSQESSDLIDLPNHYRTQLEIVYDTNQYDCGIYAVAMYYVDTNNIDELSIDGPYVYAESHINKRDLAEMRSEDAIETLYDLVIPKYKAFVAKIKALKDPLTPEMREQFFGENAAEHDEKLKQELEIAKNKVKQLSETVDNRHANKLNLIRKNALKKKADPLVEPPVNTTDSVEKETPTVHKRYKVTPPHVEQRDAVPATPSMEQTYRKIQIAENNLATIRSLIAQAEVKFKQEKKRLEETGEKIPNEKQLNDQIEKLAKLVEVTENKLVSFGDELAYLNKTQKDIPYKMSDKEKLEKIFKKFPETEQYIQRAVDGAQNLATTETVRELIMFPKREKKLSKIHKKNSAADVLSDIYDNLMNALKNII